MSGKQRIKRATRQNESAQWTGFSLVCIWAAIR